MRNGLSAKVSPLVRNIEEDVGTMCEAFQNIQRVMVCDYSKVIRAYLYMHIGKMCFRILI